MIHETPPKRIPGHPLQLSRSLCRDLLNPDYDTFALCDIHDCSLRELADLVRSQRFARAADDARDIALARARVTEPQARFNAVARLNDLAANYPVDHKERETARKAADRLARSYPDPVQPDIAQPAHEATRPPTTAQPARHSPPPPTPRTKPHTRRPTVSNQTPTIPAFLARLNPPHPPAAPSIHHAPPGPSPPRRSVPLCDPLCSIPLAHAQAPP